MIEAACLKEGIFATLSFQWIDGWTTLPHVSHNSLMLLSVWIPTNWADIHLRRSEISLELLRNSMSHPLSLFLTHSSITGTTVSFSFSHASVEISS